MKSTDHLGNIFKSQKDMAEFYGISKQTFRDRIKNGWDLKKALKKDVTRYEKHGFRTHILYSRINSQRQRCTNIKNKHYHNYGGRGIEFRFKSIKAAIEHYETLPVPSGHTFESACDSLQLDRRDNDGHYEAGNLRWCTHKENQLNKGDTVSLEKIARMKFAYENLGWSINKCTIKILEWQKGIGRKEYNNLINRLK